MFTHIILLAGAMMFQGAAAKTPSIVFVCEHGAAKSVIATAYFNKLAAERGLSYRAVFRGTTAQDDLASATQIFAIGCALPAKAQQSGKAADWSGVPEDQGYEPMRDAIVRHVRQLLDDLAR